MSHLDDLPYDTVVLILSFLEMPDWHSARLVSKSSILFDSSGDDTLWRDIVWQLLHTNHVYSSLLQSQQQQQQQQQQQLPSNTINGSERQKLLDLKPLVDEYVAQVTKQRMGRILEQAVVLNEPHHRYYGLEQLEDEWTASVDPKHSAFENGDFKCVFVGEACGGKTCLVKTMFGGDFVHEYVPTVFDSWHVSFDIDEHPLGMSLWETPSASEYDQLRILAYPKTDVILVCFAVDDYWSFEKIVTRWLPEIQKFSPQSVPMLIGTKSDKRQGGNNKRKQLEFVPREVAECMAKHQNFSLYHETSALTGDVSDRDHMFALMAKCGCIARRQQRKKYCILS